MKTTIVTGASKGLGAALVERLLELEHYVIGISSSDPQSWQITSHAHFTPIQMDLSNPELLEEKWPLIESQVMTSEPRSIHLIQNAGILEPIQPLGKGDVAGEIARGLRVNLMAPMMLMHMFIRHWQSWDSDKRIMNISSGAGRKPYPGWGMYCSSKAGIDMMSRVGAVEQETQPHPVRIASVAPGVIDTDMQTLIRTQTAEDFPPIARFHQLKEAGQLWSPTQAANLLIDYLHSEKFGDEALFDIRQWKIM